MREYTVKESDVTIAGSNTLIIINPPTGRSLKLIRAGASQRGSTTAEQVGISIGYKASVFGTYTSRTPALVHPSDPASKVTGGTAGAAGTSGVNASAEGAGTFTEVIPDNFINTIGWVFTPSEVLKEPLIWSSADSLALVIKLRNTPASLTLWSMFATFAEIG
jgi:hypothetical protein